MPHYETLEFQCRSGIRQVTRDKADQRLDSLASTISEADLRARVFWITDLYGANVSIINSSSAFLDIYSRVFFCYLLYSDCVFALSAPVRRSICLRPKPIPRIKISLLFVLAGAPTSSALVASVSISSWRVGSSSSCMSNNFVLPDSRHHYLPFLDLLEKSRWMQMDAERLILLEAFLEHERKFAA